MEVRLHNFLTFVQMNVVGVTTQEGWLDWNWAGHCAEGFPTPQLFGVTVLTELQSAWLLTLWHDVIYKATCEVLLLSIQVFWYVNCLPAFRRIIVSSCCRVKRYSLSKSPYHFTKQHNLTFQVSTNAVCFISDIMLPTTIICVLLIGNGVIIFVIFYLRKR